MIFSENNSNVAKAFTQAWGNISTPKHNSKVKVAMKSGGSYTFDYTDLTGIFEAIKEMFRENGLAIMQNGYTEQINDKNYACVETTIIHSSGEWVKSNKLMFLSAQSMQDFGGQITYMKRYSLSAMLGLSTDKDDDANGSSGNSYEYQNKNQNSNANNNKSSGGYTKTVKPTNAQEAAAIVMSGGKHAGKTLKEVFTTDKSYVKWMLESEKTDPNIKEGIELMQVAIAQQNAAKSMNQ